MKMLNYVSIKMIKEVYDLGVELDKKDYVFYCMNLIDSFSNSNELFDPHDICNDIYNMTYRELKEFKAKKEFFTEYFKKRDLKTFINENKILNLKLSTIESYVRNYGKTPLIFCDDIKNTKDIFNSLYILYKDGNKNTESGVILLGSVDKESENLFFIKDTLNMNYDNRYNLVFIQIKNTFQSIMHKPLIINENKNIDDFSKYILTNLILNYPADVDKFNYGFNVNHNNMVVPSESTTKILKIVNQCNDDAGIDINLRSLYNKIYNKYNNLGINSEDISTALVNAVKVTYESLVKDLAFKYNIVDTSILITEGVEKFIHE